MELRRSAEDYLEAILVLQNEKGAVRSVDVAHYLNFSKPSVSRAVTNLRTDGYLVMQEDGQLALTDKGREVAENVFERHNVLTQWLLSIGVSPKAAAEDACQMEHVICDETFAKLKEAHQRNIKLEKEGAPDLLAAPAAPRKAKGSKNLAAGAEEDKPGKKKKKKKKN